MSLEVQSIREKEDQIIADIDNETGQTTPDLEISWNRIFARSIAGLSKLFDLLVVNAIRDVFLSSTQNLNRLQEWAGWTKTVRKPATSAILNVTGTGVPGSVITGGLSGVYFVSDEGKKYYFLSDYTIPASGIADTQLKALIAGASGNIFTGKLSITAQNANISDTLTIKNSDPLNHAGTDQESIESWRSEMQRVAQRPVTSDNFSFYYSTARQVPDILAGYPYTKLPGQLTLFIRTNSTDGTATTSQKKRVWQYFRGEIDGIVRLPVDLLGYVPDDATKYRFWVGSVYVVNFHCDVQALTPLTDSNKEAVDNAIKSYFKSLEPYIKGVSNSNNGQVQRQALRAVIQATIETIEADSYHDVIITNLATGATVDSYYLNEAQIVSANETSWI